MLTLPHTLYQAWAFVAPGLYLNEKRLALPLVASSTLLFFVGMAFAYFLVFPTVFGFMAKIAPEGVAWMTDIEKYLSFVLSTFLAFGVDELSVTPRSVLPLRNAVRMTDTRESSERILSDLDSDYTAR